MTDKLERQRRIDAFMSHPISELDIKDAIELVDKIADTHEQTAWQLTRTAEKVYIGTIKHSKYSIDQFGDTPAQALTFAGDQFIKNIAILKGG